MDGDASSDLIAKLSDTEFEWSLAGCLEQARAGHGVVFDGASFVVAGGQYDKVTENAHSRVIVFHVRLSLRFWMHSLTIQKCS